MHADLTLNAPAMRVGNTCCLLSVCAETNGSFQTGTGKTYTMMGPPRDRGVNARALGDLFCRSAARRGEVSSPHG